MPTARGGRCGGAARSRLRRCGSMAVVGLVAATPLAVCVGTLKPLSRLGKNVPGALPSGGKARPRPLAYGLHY